jgi:hypothetical protein|tara:strand:+ start:237 stop:1043 length:807 start_codon:yes stop_codon:yes gene_type:complete
MIDLQSTKFLNDEQIAGRAPAVFTKTPSSEVSKHYTHIPTSRVIDDMRMLGWDVVDAKEVKARKASTRGVQKHMVVFRNPDVIINGDDGDTVFPQILLTNSHDGKNAFQFTAGLFRMICENGLVISTEKFEDVKMRHMGYTFEDLQVKIKDMVARLPLTVESMNKMKEIEMGESDALAFAKKCLQSRFGEKEMVNKQFDLKEIISPTRNEDKGTDVWSRFNVIQEKIIDGDFEYLSGNKIRKARRVKNFKQDQKINQELFSLALEYTN